MDAHAESFCRLFGTHCACLKLSCKIHSDAIFSIFAAFKRDLESLCSFIFVTHWLLWSSLFSTIALGWRPQSLLFLISKLHTLHSSILSLTMSQLFWEQKYIIWCSVGPFIFTDVIVNIIVGCRSSGCRRFCWCYIIRLLAARTGANVSLLLLACI